MDKVMIEHYEFAGKIDHEARAKYIARMVNQIVQTRARAENAGRTYDQTPEQEAEWFADYYGHIFRMVRRTGR